MSSDLGRLLIIAGLLLVGVGLFLVFVGKFNFIGKLPGDLKIEKENFTFFFPLGTSLLISLILSLFFWLFRR